jgi:hypothetical protein
MGLAGTAAAPADPVPAAVPEPPPPALQGGPLGRRAAPPPPLAERPPAVAERGDRAAVVASAALTGEALRPAGAADFNVDWRVGAASVFPAVRADPGAGAAVDADGAAVGAMA